ncbi:PREDICTED: RRP12-like protein isoform X2 [Theobroma cacao]|uniref:RRP12-like protein isoform X2 n=1 Tax=Theobroma cacao TaxID=3641 RepID=A0AB32WJ45_THECC|nr:PREDICTED: RRP12-like protein isoform X2 [Theobroma cacao]
MKKKQTPNHPEEDIRENPNELELENETETPFKDGTNICQQLMDRYSKSAAPQHRHLLATAAAMRSILSAESLPLSPPAYFAAAISALDDDSATTLDSTAVGALLTFLSIVVLLVPKGGISSDKAKEAVEVVVRVVGKEGLGVASLRSGVKCLGVLVDGFCDLEDWHSVRFGLETLLGFAIDKRPKVRRCAQEYLEKVFKSFQSSIVIKEASKLVLSLFKKHMPLALTLSTIKSGDDSKDETLSKPENLEVLHMLDLVKLAVPYLSAKVRLKILSELRKLMSSEFSSLTRNIHKTIEVLFGNSNVEAIIPEMENIIVSLASYVSGEKNPVDTLISASTLLKCALDKLHAGESNSWMKNVPLVFGSLAVLLTSEASTTSLASVIMKELISNHIDLKSFSAENNGLGSEEADAIKSICAILENTLSSSDGIPNEHVMAVLTVLFQRLGESSYIFMKSIVHKLAELMSLAKGDTSNMNHLQNCIGSAVTVIGPERILTLLPITLHSDDISYSNVWLVPILKDYVVGACLRYYMESIVPLAKSFQLASSKDLQDRAHGLWGLLPAFCRYPIDMHKTFKALAELLIDILKEDSFMHENIASALQILVNQNKSILRSGKDAGEANNFTVRDSVLELRSSASYSKKSATRNMKVLSSCAPALLQALSDVFVCSLPAKRLYLKDAIGCLASITDSSITKRIFVSLVQKLQFIDGEGEIGKQAANANECMEKEQGNLSTTGKDAHRCVILELASSFVAGAEEDLIDFIYALVKQTFQETDEIGHCEAYFTLSRVLEEHAWFCSSRVVELIDLLLGLKSPADIASLRSRLDCFNILMVQTLKMAAEFQFELSKFLQMSSLEENTKPFLILNEIIVTLKDGKEEPRKATYDILLKMSSTLRNLSDLRSDPPYHKLISMIMGYLSGSSPHIKSGAVAALSVLVYNDPEICVSVPDLVSSILSLLQTKAVEVIKAVLGFVKVLVSSLQAKDLQNFLSDIIHGVVQWSSISRNHFRSKVTIILEIVTRKCGIAAVQLVTPEKHRGFLNTVIENRRSKTTPKEVDANDAETVLVDSLTEGSQKRKHKGLGTFQQKNDFVEHRKRKRDKRDSGKLPDSSEPGISAAHGGRMKMAKGAKHVKNSMKGHSDGNGEKNKKNFKKRFARGQKRKIDEVSRSKKDEAGSKKHSFKVGKQKKLRGK